MPIDHHQHSRSGIRFSRLGFGGAPLGNLNRRLDDAAAVASVLAAVEAGVTLIDTSPLYGQGLSAARIGSALRQLRRERVVLSTKVGRILVPGAGSGGGGRASYVGALPFTPRFDYSYDGAMRSLEQSLLLLGTDHVDIVLIHDVDGWTHGIDKVEERFAEAMEGAYRALDQLRADGTVRAIGVGLNEAGLAARFARAADLDAVLLAGRYSLLEQGALDDFLPLADAKGIAVLMGGVFNSGILATGAVEGASYNYRPAPPEIAERTRRIERICEAHGVPLAVAAARFPLGHPAVASVVLGMVSRSEVERNLRAFDHPIPPALWCDLADAGLLRPDAPVPEAEAGNEAVRPQW